MDDQQVDIDCRGRRSYRPKGKNYVADPTLETISRRKVSINRENELLRIIAVARLSHEILLADFRSRAEIYKMFDKTNKILENAEAVQLLLDEVKK